MTTLKKLKTVAAVALAISAGFGAVGAAHAAVQASAVLEVSNFQIQSSTGAILALSDFGNPLISDNGTNNSSLNGVGGPVQTITLNGGAPFDVPQSCIGAVCPAQNSFAHLVPPGSVTGPPANQLGRSDSLLTGYPINGLSPAPATGANASTVAEVLLSSSGTGTGDSRLGLNTSFTFTLAQSRQIQFDFDADLYLRAFLSNDINNGAAQASVGLVFAIDSLGAGGATTNVFQWAPDGVLGSGITGGTEIADGANLNTSIVALVGGDNFSRDSAGAQNFTALTNLLAAGSYRFTIRQTTAADANQVIPEPATLLLTGGALVGLAMFRRKKVA